ncbi:hypothetical protein V1503_10665 [Bacillus sp. SCS-151]
MSDPVVHKACTTDVCKYETPTIKKYWERWIYWSGSVEQYCNC